MRTHAEQTGYAETARYADTLAWLRRLVEATDVVDLRVLGLSPEGRDIVMVVASADRAFSPKSARSTGKPIVLVQAGIHPGEIEGKDAGLALLRDIAVTGVERTLLDEVILLFIPVFNVDGHERFGPYTRINQNGPAESGWRSTAQNYNLNRDYMKADSQEMRTWLHMFNSWMPDLFIDLHNTDGADFQYDITYCLEMHANMHPGLVEWQQAAFLKTIFPVLETQGHRIAPYVVLRDETDLQKGCVAFISEPRYSTGYTAIRNRPGLLVEMHMLKDYETRVRGCYDIVRETLHYAGTHGKRLRDAVTRADADTAARGDKPYALQLDIGSAPRMFEFLGYEYTREPSGISGASWTRYHPDRPRTFTIPVFDDVRIEKKVTAPAAYIVPAALTDAIMRLDLHGIRYRRLRKAITLEVDTWKFSRVEWAPEPFEGRHRVVDFDAKPVRRDIEYAAGSAVVDPAQEAGNAILHLLEPAAPDSLLRWGFFDLAFEQKEYAEDRVIEELARGMLAEDPALKQEFERRLAADAVFAGDPKARLRWFYERTPWFDERLNVYPVGRALVPVDPTLLTD